MPCYRSLCSPFSLGFLVGCLSLTAGLAGQTTSNFGPQPRAGAARQQAGPGDPAAAAQQRLAPNARPRSQTPVGQALPSQGVASVLDPSRPPEGFALSAKEQQWLDQVLAYWEQNTSKIRTYSCEFTRWEYDPVFGPKDPNKAKTISGGEIKYAAPDKGVIRVTRIEEFSAAENNYAPRPAEDGEHWVCDGASVYEFDHSKKMLIETKLPAEMQGQAIANSPLPFLFGVEAAKIKERYWLRELPSKDGKPKFYQLEAVPRRREDAANFLKIQLFLDQKQFRPVGMITYELNGQSRSSYQFTNIKENDLIAHIQNFMNSFVSPKPPRGYTKLTHNLGEPIPTSTAQQPPAQAQRPGDGESPRR